MKLTSSASICILFSAVQHLAGFATASPDGQVPSKDLPSFPQGDGLNTNSALYLLSKEYRDGSLMLPYQGDGKELPRPPAGMTLKAVALGAGEQHYMCKNHKPVPYGASADLFDPTATLASATPSEYSIYTGIVLDAPGSFEMKSIGRHYFDGQGVPSFVIDGKGFFRGVKTASIDPPKDYYNNLRPGVPWLQMRDKGDSQVFKMAYRVATQGGKAPKSCRKNNRLYPVKYTALYFFYG